MHQEHESTNPSSLDQADTPGNQVHNGQEKSRRAEMALSRTPRVGNQQKKPADPQRTKVSVWNCTLVETKTPFFVPLSLGSLPSRSMLRRSASFTDAVHLFPLTTSAWSSRRSPSRGCRTRNLSCSSASSLHLIRATPTAALCSNSLTKFIREQSTSKRNPQLFPWRPPPQYSGV